MRSLRTGAASTDCQAHGPLPLRLRSAFSIASLGKGSREPFRGLRPRLPLGCLGMHDRLGDKPVKSQAALAYSFAFSAAWAPPSGRWDRRVRRPDRAGSQTPTARRRLLEYPARSRAEFGRESLVGGSFPGRSSRSRDSFGEGEARRPLQRRGFVLRSGLCCLSKLSGARRGPNGFHKTT